MLDILHNYHNTKDALAYCYSVSVSSRDRETNATDERQERRTLPRVDGRLS